MKIHTILTIFWKISTEIIIRRPFVYVFSEEVVAFFLVICRTFLCYLLDFSLLFVAFLFVICRTFLSYLYISFSASLLFF